STICSRSFSGMPSPASMTSTTAKRPCRLTSMRIGGLPCRAALSRRLRTSRRSSRGSPLTRTGRPSTGDLPSAAVPALPEPAGRKMIGDFPALVGGQNLRCVGKRLRDPLACTVNERHLLGAQLLDVVAIDQRSGQKLARLLASGPDLLPHGQEILERCLDDGLKLLLLLGGCIDVDRQVPDRAVGSILDLG